MKTQKIIRLVRLKEKDNDEIKYSDYDIISSLNEAIRYTNMRLSTMNSDFLEKAVVLDEKEINDEIEANNAQVEEENRKEMVRFGLTGVDLPDDFLSLMGVVRTGEGCCHNNYRLKCAQPGMHLERDEYYIMGNKLFTRCHTVRLLYRAAIPQVTDADDNIELPDFFTDGLAKMTSMILHNDPNTDVMRQAMDSVIDSLIPHRRYSNMRSRMPFKV